MSWTDSWLVFFHFQRFFFPSTSELFLEGSMLLDGSIFEVNGADSHSVDGFRHLKQTEQTVHP